MSWLTTCCALGVLRHKFTTVNSRYKHMVGAGGAMPITNICLNWENANNGRMRHEIALGADVRALYMILRWVC